MTSLSFCAIVKDEEQSLPLCLASVRDVVDEMIVVDTGSKDKTREIAAKLGARVYEFPWGDNFAQARNEALKYASGDWILVLDADERLTSEASCAIPDAIANPQALVVNLVRHEVGATQSPYSLVSRLFRNHPELQFSRPYHATIDDSAIALKQREPHWQVTEIDPVAILHYGYQPGAIASKDKLQRAKRAMEGFLAQNPQDAYVCNKLGALYLQENRLEDGLKLLQQGLNYCQDEPLLQFELHYHVANAYTRKGDANQAAIQYQAALKQPILPRLKLGAYNNLGSLLQNVGELSLAEGMYREALKIDEKFAIAHYNLGMIYNKQSRYEDAIAAYHNAIALDENYAPAHQNLGVTYFKCGQISQSVAHFQKAIALYQESNPPEAERLTQTLQEMGLLS
ncbi:MAG: glycosyltransferase [Jaaginema sp. PMC 1079.18]|nr:glycosyltransferase [Jaaginema sp. PMC 1080.18]MEC4851981.1 glycosyltransferase [Jaaginema sp. PMC 1079.18]MEC4868677.1 glycosyltransferase [Jaaginema sp. PMC 1078.18]